MTTANTGKRYWWSGAYFYITTNDLPSAPSGVLGRVSLEDAWHYTPMKTLKLVPMDTHCMEFEDAKRYVETLYKVVGFE